MIGLVIIVMKPILICRSYTTFKYSNLSITPTVIKAGQNVTISVTVTNAGSRTSDEVYVLCEQMSYH